MTDTPPSSAAVDSEDRHGELETPPFAGLYQRLRRLAAAYLRDERRDHTLAPTALVHEAYLRLEGRDPPTDRRQLFTLTATVMRHVLIDSARRRQAAKRSAGERVTLHEDKVTPAQRDVYLLALDEALERLAMRDPELARVVELRFFAGLSVAETAAALDLSTATIKRRWRLAKAWLHREIAERG